MPYKIIYLEKAYLDLETILDYIAEDSPSRANEYLQFLNNEILKLADFPKIGVLCKRKRIRRDCRVFIIENYLVFYKIDKTSQSIIIGRILHHTVNYRTKELF